MYVVFLEFVVKMQFVMHTGGMWQNANAQEIGEAILIKNALNVLANKVTIN